MSEADAARWALDLQAMLDRLKPCFSSRSAWSVAVGYMVGLLSGAERKNAWQMAEQVGAESPYAFQDLMSRAVWDADCARDVVAAYVYEHLGDAQGVHVLDETGFLKKGTMSVGVQRQYTGTAGKQENCQVAVFLAYHSPKGAALVDRALYMPEAWIEAPERLKKAGVPSDVGFATKAELGRRMLESALVDGAPRGWVTGDEEYGKASALRTWLERKAWPYVLAVASNVTAWRGDDGLVKSVSQVLAELPKSAWRPLSAGAGEKGERWYEWVAVTIPSEPSEVREGWARWVLLRRNIETGELAYYLAAGPAEAPLEELVRVAGARWAIEVCFEQAKGEVGLDQYEVRTWKGWHRHITLSMAALAFLAVTRHHEDAKGGLTSGLASRMTAFREQRAQQEPQWQAAKQRHPSG